MNEADVRALVREAIDRHLGRPDSAGKVAPYLVGHSGDRVGQVGDAAGTAGDETPDTRRARLQSSYGHASHIFLQVAPGSEVDDGMCVIEPRVRCNHCGFCQSYGH
jgi:hypothetical protein